MGTQVPLARAWSYPPRQVFLRQKSLVLATKLVRRTTKLSPERGVRCTRLQYEREDVVHGAVTRQCPGFTCVELPLRRLSRLCRP